MILSKDYTIQQIGKVLSVVGDEDRIIINKYENLVVRLKFETDGTIDGILYLALMNPVTGKYYITPVMSDNSVVISTDISNYVGIWKMILIATEYEIEQNDIDQSKVTYVSNEFKRLMVKDNFLDEEHDETPERVKDLGVEEALENLKNAEHNAKISAEHADDVYKEVLALKLNLETSTQEFKDWYIADRQVFEQYVATNMEAINNQVVQGVASVKQMGEKQVADINAITDSGKQILSSHKDDLSNELTEQVNDSLEEVEAWVHGHLNYPERNQDNAKYYSDKASISAEEASGFAQDSATSASEAAMTLASIADKVASAKTEITEHTTAKKSEAIQEIATTGNAILDKFLPYDGIPAQVEKKVGKVEGKSLIADSEIARLATLHNYDDTEVKADITTLEEKVDSLNSFDIVPLTTGQYDSNGIPTIQGAKTNILYLVPSNEEAPNLWIEWLYVNNKWEKFGSATIDLSDYVTRTDLNNKFDELPEMQLTKDDDDTLVLSGVVADSLLLQNLLTMVQTLQNEVNELKNKLN